MKISLAFFLTLLAATQIIAQDITISTGRTTIGLNEFLELNLTISNAKLENYSNFPDIDGFTKRGKSNSTRTNIINGKISQSQTITQNYMPTKEGTFTIPSFAMTVNGKKVEFSSVEITVGPAISRQKYDPFADFWNQGQGRDEQEYVNVKEEAFFAVNTNKNKVYVGEGFNMNIAFYVSLKNRAKMDFYKISDQLTEILKKVKPTNCWEENFGIDQITPEYVTINGQQYQRYKIYQASFFPLNDQDIEIPSVSLKMIKYKVAKRPSFFGQNMQEDFKSFSSKAKKIKVMELPPHPMKGMVNVGNFKLEERISGADQETGQSFIYNFAIAGEGNISAIKEIQLPETREFDFYPPNISQQINRGNNTVYGAKAFKYNIEPREPGSYNMGDYFQWIYFNPSSGTYDTLRSELVVNVTGESKRNMEIASNVIGGFYENMDSANNKLTSTWERSWIPIITNISILLVLATAGYFVFRKG
ncbi:BatD family protein [Flammeovirgaceae bacterium SG7u.111]|nr:BatD family protein [Flammeovirgaceae bacterium SG7u.132]WPO37940.1 BatD family protein [Flammeovirgaceae bacterium SG7u.111]